MPYVSNEEKDIVQKFCIKGAQDAGNNSKDGFEFINNKIIE